VQILKNNIKNSFYKGIGALVPYKTPLRVVLYTGLVRQINPYKTRSLIYYLKWDLEIWDCFIIAQIMDVQN
jgi:hypothetical protein